MRRVVAPVRWLSFPWGVGMVRTMPPEAQRGGWKWAVVLVAAAAVVVSLALFLRPGAPPEGAPQGKEAAARPAEPASTKRATPATERDPSPADPAATPEVEAAPGGGPPPERVPDGDYPVDLMALRKRIPDNLYWQLGAPTQDPIILQQRAEDTQHWNEMFGKVQSGTASDEEIQQYYDHRKQLSEDYLEFATVTLAEYRAKLPERDIGMYELSQKLHRTRLDEIPRQIEDARARKRAQDTRRQEWQNQKQDE